MTPSPTPDQFALLYWIVGLGMAASIASNIAMVVKTMRRTPPIDRTLQDYATKAEVQQMKCDWQTRCQEMHARCDKTFGEIFSILRAQNKEITDRLDKYHAELAQWQLGMERQIGTLEGRMDNES